MQILYYTFIPYNYTIHIPSILHAIIYIHAYIPSSHFPIVVAPTGRSVNLSTEALEPVLDLAVLVGGLGYLLKWEVWRSGVS